jgi:Flp pilus assembly pilin Flp
MVIFQRVAISEENRGEELMSTVRNFIVRVRELNRGQTMAEYALILAAVAVVVYVGYQTMGTTITGLLSSVDTSL